MQRILRSILLAVFAAALCIPAAGPAPAQQSTAEGLSEEALNKLNDLQTAAQQLAQQQGQFAGKSIGPQFASATNQLMQVLLNFDIWACGTAVTALHLKRQRLAVAAAAASPPDPALDRAVDDFGRLIAQLQELCDRYVHRIYGDPAGGGGTAGTPPPPPVEQPPPPRMSVQERICYDRCHDLYVQFFRAELDSDRAVREAEAARQRARTLRQAADRDAERARAARQRAEETRREYDRLQAAMTAATSQAERLRIADQLSRLNPDGARRHADAVQREADQAARTAQQAEGLADRAETRASALYDAMMEIYEALMRCIRTCVEQARQYDRVEIDPRGLFSGLPRSAPRPPPFYRPAAPPVPRAQPREQPRQQAALPLDARSARMLAIHNSERAAVGAPPLRWNPALAESATTWAQQLARMGQLTHAPRQGRGIERENLSRGLLGWGPDQMMGNWLREKQNFQPGVFPNVSRTGRWEDVSHYSQMIWPTTTDLGCGMATGGGFNWLVCRYSPGGNKDGKPVGAAVSRTERGR